RQGEPGCRALHLVHNGLRTVAGDECHLRTKTNHLADGIEIKNQIFIESYAPSLEKTGKSVIVGNFVTAQLQWRIQQEHRTAAVLDIFLDSIDFGLLVI